MAVSIGQTVLGAMKEEGSRFTSLMDLARQSASARSEAQFRLAATNLAEFNVMEGLQGEITTPQYVGGPEGAVRLGMGNEMPSLRSPVRSEDDYSTDPSRRTPKSMQTLRLEAGQSRPQYGLEEFRTKNWFDADYGQGPDLSPPPYSYGASTMGAGMKVRPRPLEADDVNRGFTDYNTRMDREETYVNPSYSNPRKRSMRDVGELSSLPPTRETGGKWTEESAVAYHYNFDESVKVANRNTEDLDPDVQKTVARLITDAAKEGITLTIAETTRSRDRQAYLYGSGRAEGVDGQGNALPKGNILTHVLDSDHLGGRAIDLWSANEEQGGPGEKGWNWIQSNAPRYGFKVLGSWDAGHISLEGRSPTLSGSSEDIRDLLQKQGVPDDLLDAMEKHGITSPNHQAAFLAQIKAESGPGFDQFTEVNPSSSLGKWHGRGYIQLSNDFNYTRYGELLSDEYDETIDLYNNPELAADPRYSADIAAMFYNDNVRKHVDNDDWAGAVKGVLGRGAKDYDITKRRGFYEDYLGEFSRDFLNESNLQEEPAQAGYSSANRALPQLRDIASALEGSSARADATYVAPAFTGGEGLTLSNLARSQKPMGEMTKEELLAERGRVRGAQQEEAGSRSIYGSPDEAQEEWRQSEIDDTALQGINSLKELMSLRQDLLTQDVRFNFDKLYDFDEEGKRKLTPSELPERERNRNNVMDIKLATYELKDYIRGLSPYLASYLFESQEMRNALVSQLGLLDLFEKGTEYFDDAEMVSIRDDMSFLKRFVSSGIDQSNVPVDSIPDAIDIAIQNMRGEPQQGGSPGYVQELQSGQR